MHTTKQPSLLPQTHTGTSARFEGMADNFAKLFFMMYPYQETTKIEHKNDKSALYTYTMPKNKRQ